MVDAAAALQRGSQLGDGEQARRGGSAGDFEHGAGASRQVMPPS